MDESKKKADERSSIAAFYAGRCVFVTGATGFLGKVLLEKLLRSCPDIGEIYMLIRPRREQSIDDRLRSMLRLPLFDKLRKENPSSFEKLIPVEGDVSAEGLGLGPADRRTIAERVSVIFHVAANVRFDENLRKDVLTNTRSTRDVCILASSVKQLAALVHVSTAYSQAEKPEIEEIMYPPIVNNWRDTIRMVETLDDKILRPLTFKYVGAMPNTYTFSKRLAEQVIQDYSKDLPCVIFRPSIVISSVADPVPGWLDNFNGPVGLMIAGGKGIHRVTCLQQDAAADFLPVDLAIKVMITSAWKRGTETIARDSSVHVYNGGSQNIRRVNSDQLIEMGLKLAGEVPLEGILWYPRVFMTSSRSLHYAMTMLLHVIPAFFVDLILKTTGHRPILLDIQRKTYCSVVQLAHFLHNEWMFRNAKMFDILWPAVPPAERAVFGYDLTNFDTNEYFRHCLVGAKRYLLNEDMSRVDEARRHYNRMKLIDQVFNVCMVALLVWILWITGILFYGFASVGYYLDGSFLFEA